MDPTIAPQDDPNATPNGSEANREPSAGLVAASSYPRLNDVTGPATELTADDILRMKNLRSESGTKSDFADLQSAMSVADSASSFEDHVPTSTEGEDGSEEGHSGSSDDEEQGLESKAVIRDDYLFGRHRSSSPELNSQTVTVLNHPFELLNSPVDEKAEEYKKYFANGKVFLIGTAHFSPESQQDVRQTIAKASPDVVMVELCPSRRSILEMDEKTLLSEAHSLNREKVLAIIRQSGVIQAILDVLLRSTSAHIARELGMAPGGEFRAARQAAASLQNCSIVLGDRPIQVTLQRALGALGFFQKCRLFFHILTTNRVSITQEDVERSKNKDRFEELLKEMADEFPQLSKIFVEERDQYMTYVLHSLLRETTIEKYNACKRADANFEPVHVVAVVGFAHVSGIVANWNSTSTLRSFSREIPEPSRSSKVLRFTLRAAVVGGTAYAAYRLGRFTHHYVRSVL